MHLLITCSASSPHQLTRHLANNVFSARVKSSFHQHIFIGMIDQDLPALATNRRPTHVQVIAHLLNGRTSVTVRFLLSVITSISSDTTGP